MSHKPLAARLQVKPGRTLAVIGMPDGLDGLVDARTEPSEADVVLLFVRDRAAFEAALPPLLAVLRPSAILWVAYPKLTSPLAGDLHRDVVRAAVPAYGLDTVSAIAIDAVWSALRLKRVAPDR